MNLPQLRRVRWAVRATLVLGLAASTVGNILHANPNPVSQTISAWPVAALYLTIELISRIPVHRRSLAFARLFAAAIIAGIAAWVSYWHMAGVAARYGETGASPYLLPLSVDGLVVVASICLVELGGRIREAHQTAAVAHPAIDQRALVVTSDARTAASRRARRVLHGRRVRTLRVKHQRPVIVAGQAPDADPRLKQDLDLAICVMSDGLPDRSHRQIAGLMRTSAARVGRALRGREPADVAQPGEPVNGHVPNLEDSPV